MNIHKHTARRAIRLTRGSRVSVTYKGRSYIGIIQQVSHDRYTVNIPGVTVRSFLKERCEGLTDPDQIR
jgi:hypothetical protein